jgi:hypothetical protein
VFTCDSCETAVVKTWRGYRATPAAAAAIRDSTGEVLEVLCDLELGDCDYQGRAPMLEADGQVRFRDVGDDAGKRELVAIMAAHAKLARSHRRTRS